MMAASIMFPSKERTLWTRVVSGLLWEGSGGGGVTILLGQGGDD